jgi:thymidylate synthase
MNKDLWVDWWKYPNNFKYLDEHLKWPELPVLNLNPDVENIEDFTRDDIQIINYKPWPKIDAPVAV